MASKKQDEGKILLTLTNIKYLVEGLDALLTTDLDGDKRATVIQLRNDLLSHINSIFNDYSWILLKYRLSRFEDIVAPFCDIISVDWQTWRGDLTW